MRSIAESGINFLRRHMRPVVFAAGVGGTVYCGGVLSAEIQRLTDLNEKSHSIEMRSASVEQVSQLDAQIYGSFNATWYLFLGTGGSAIAGAVTIYDVIKKRKPSSAS